MINLNDGVATIKKGNGELDSFLKDATWVVAHDEVNDKVSCALTVQVTLAVHDINSLCCYTRCFMLILKSK